MKIENRVFAHRGLNTLAPENTMSAFKKVVEHGLNWIETDVDILGDGTAIICHDTTLDRTTNKTGGYYELTVKDLPSIDAGSWFSPEFAGEPLPTLHQLVDFMNETGLNANIEIKSNEAGATMTRQLIKAVISELKRLDGPEVIVSCFNHVLLSEFHALAPQIPLGCLYETCALYDDWRSVLELVGASYIHPEDAGLTREKVRAFRDAGFGVNVWTVNSPARANELFNWGVTGVFTDTAHLIPLRN
ncbi:glycerophosphoryl diester phosphodiesterase [Varibaculum cambriense]|uniref:glycerophosphoryl diester phosphodiesterase n=1 Tax=Varibaculum cambriense TaxID=184870 RepID=UPI00291155DE|nr:glycerophosphoryl diester phosphodiesterase [Varibaculum cambriense]MDU5541227.1 glycerophosphoryl diester phosphodiesterase [Varibaculum cambriense]